MRVLVLAGTTQARELIAMLSQQGLDVQASLAGATRAPRDLGVPTRIGGFGGADGLVDYLKEQAIDVLVDATHPFAAQMTLNAAHAAAISGVKHGVLQRAGWQPERGDTWKFVDKFEAVADIIPEGCTVFLGTGRQTLSQFASLTNRRLLCRVIDPPTGPFPFENGAFVVGQPPFSVAQEVAFFQAEKIDYLVVKNAGGDASKSKLIAARQLGLPVVMQRRPPVPDAPLFEQVEPCAKWVLSQ